MSDHTLSHENNRTIFFYCFDEAVDIILQHIPEALSKKMSPEDILLVLELKDEYYDLCHPALSVTDLCNVPTEIDMFGLYRFLQYHSHANNLELSDDDIMEILDAELIYFEQNGVLRDAGEWLN